MCGTIIFVISTLILANVPKFHRNLTTFNFFLGDLFRGLGASHDDADRVTWFYRLVYDVVVTWNKSRGYDVMVARVVT